MDSKLGETANEAIGEACPVTRVEEGRAIENLALRQQLANLRRASDRPRLRGSDRAFWVLLSRFWSHWKDVLVVVKPDTVIAWDRAGFRLFWRWKSRSPWPADGCVSPTVKQLIRRILRVVQLALHTPARTSSFWHEAVPPEYFASDPVAKDPVRRTDHDVCGPGVTGRDKLCADVCEEDRKRNGQRRPRVG